MIPNCLKADSISNFEQSEKRPRGEALRCTIGPTLYKRIMLDIKKYNFP
jgi:hypothetical protein